MDNNHCKNTNESKIKKVIENSVFFVVITHSKSLFGN